MRAVVGALLDVLVRGAASVTARLGTIDGAARRRLLHRTPPVTAPVRAVVRGAPPVLVGGAQGVTDDRQARGAPALVPDAADTLGSSSARDRALSAPTVHDGARVELLALVAAGESDHRGQERNDARIPTTQCSAPPLSAPRQASPLTAPSSTAIASGRRRASASPRPLRRTRCRRVPTMRGPRCGSDR